jgi:hypothetical protein
VQFFCSVIQPYIRGTVSRAHNSLDCDRYRDGVQLTAVVRDETATDTCGWRDVNYRVVIEIADLVIRRSSETLLGLTRAV